MKKFMGLLVAVFMISILAMGGAALAGVDFTLEFNRDFDALETSGFAELGFSLAADPFDFSLTYTHDFLPEEADTITGSIGLTLGPLDFGYERELTVNDPGVGTAGFTIGPISFGYEYEFNVDESGKLTATFSKSI